MKIHLLSCFVQLLLFWTDNVNADVIDHQLDRRFLPGETPISAPTGQCRDSPVKFRTRYKGRRIGRFCTWVGEDKCLTAERCALNHVSTHCPITCATCEVERCSDSRLLLIYQVGGVNRFTKCKNLSGSSDPLCAIDEFAATCRKKCESCMPTNCACPQIPSCSPSVAPTDKPSALPSVLPSVLPSTLPSLTPTDKHSAPSVLTTVSLSPSSAPTGQCRDSPLRFRTYDGEEIDDNKIGNFCKWVGKNKCTTAERCALPGVSIHCPMTCATCEKERCSDSQLLLAYQIGGVSRFTRCSDISGSSDPKCAIDGVAASCRAKCKSCMPTSCACPQIPSCTK